MTTNNLNRLVYLLLILILAVACSPSGSYRKLHPDEKVAIKTAKKLVPANAPEYYVLVMTSKGDIVLKLYNETPLHRDNFVSKVKQGFYDSLLFHRVIDSFMIQGGDPDSKYAKKDEALGNGSAPGDRIAAEILATKGILHKRGALGAARSPNPEKASSNCQFYIVQRHAWTKEELQKEAIRRDTVFNAEQVKTYTTIGGSPHLDNHYTVFGEAVSGLDVVDSIAATPRDRRNRPVANIRMRMFLIHSPGGR